MTSASSAAPRASVRLIRMGSPPVRCATPGRHRRWAASLPQGLAALSSTYAPTSGMGSVGATGSGTSPGIVGSGSPARAARARRRAARGRRRSARCDRESRHEDRRADDPIEVADVDARTMKWPRVPPPTIAASVAVATIWTAEIRMPARITGSATGTSTRADELRLPHAHPAAGLDEVGVDLAHARRTCSSRSAGSRARSGR